MSKPILFVAMILIAANSKSQTIAEQAPCITDQEYAVIEKLISTSHTNHQSNKTDGATPSLIWPVQAANGIKDCGIYQVSAYVDHNANVGQIQDFNCGTNTYDGHRGTDISTWPFNFIKMDNDLAEVVAAADGTIISVHDGEFDRNCSSNQLTANYVIIEHSDGSKALYWHMKNGSVTKKTVNQTVVAGEHLGMVGSSGSSSGPH